VAIQTLKVPPYEAAVQGAESLFRQSFTYLDLADLSNADIQADLRISNAKLILAVGTNALTAVKNIRTIPVVYIMALHPENIVNGATNITGVDLVIPPDKQMNALLKIIPSVQSVGLLYDPSQTGLLQQKAASAAEGLNLQLRSAPVHSANQVPDLLKNLRNQIDIFWMVPDLTVVTSKTVEFLLLFSIENRIPILTFSDKYLKLGALVSISADPYDMGLQAGEMAQRILNGTPVQSIPRAEARKPLISVNPKVAAKLGIQLEGKILNEVNMVE
jgi:putative ABC transport system substrate-binding protein